MKLIHCTACRDLVLLKLTEESCACGKSRGKYRTDGLNADIAGPCVPVGILNETFFDAVSAHLNDGGNHDFTAFTMGLETPHVHRGSIGA